METILSELEITYKKKYVSQEKVSTSLQCWNLFRGIFNQSTIDLVEEMNVLLLDNANHPIGVFRASLGGTKSTIVDIKLILSIALKCMAHSIIISHNHPSGSDLPSREDLSITEELKCGCKMVGITLLDHIIMTSSEKYFLFSALQHPKNFHQ